MQSLGSLASLGWMSVFPKQFESLDARVSVALHEFKGFRFMQVTDPEYVQEVVPSPGSVFVQASLNVQTPQRPFVVRTCSVLVLVFVHAMYCGVVQLNSVRA